MVLNLEIEEIIIESHETGTREEGEEGPLHLSASARAARRAWPEEGRRGD